MRLVDSEPIATATRSIGRIPDGSSSSCIAEVRRNREWCGTQSRRVARHECNTIRARVHLGVISCPESNALDAVPSWQARGAKHRHRIRCSAPTLAPLQHDPPVSKDVQWRGASMVDAQETLCGCQGGGEPFASVEAKSTLRSATRDVEVLSSPPFPRMGSSLGDRPLAAAMLVMGWTGLDLNVLALGGWPSRSVCWSTTRSSTSRTCTAGSVHVPTAGVR